MFSRNWVTPDGDPVSFSVVFEPHQRDSHADPGPEVTIPDRDGWWRMSSWGGVLPAALQKKIDKIMAGAEDVDLGIRLVPSQNPYAAPVPEAVTGYRPSVDDQRTIATLLLAAAREADDPNHAAISEARVEALETAMNPPQD